MTSDAPHGVAASDNLAGGIYEQRLTASPFQDKQQWSIG